MTRVVVEPTSGISSATIGRLVGVSGAGEVLVSVASVGSQPRSARSCIPLTLDQIGRDVVLVFEDACPSKPIVVGVLEAPHAEPNRDARSVTARLDGTRVVLSASKEIVLECGDSSITMTSAGKVLIRGA